ncbi:endolytic transglycosylase MltG [Orbaceae bacterium ESL0727]|nr:endolytic transglycosylase MltG [Orbaceae bacterium ESL0727]
MIKKIFIYSLAIVLFLAGGTATIAYYFLHQFSEQLLHETDSNKIFVLKKGTTLPQLVAQLKQEHLVDNAYLLPYLYKLDPALNSIKAGTYQLQPHMTVEEFLALLVSGKESQFSVQFVEGKSAKDWLTVLQNTPYIEQTLAGKSPEDIGSLLGIEGSIEGWLSPNTYLYTAETSDVAILKRAYRNMKNNLQKIWDNRDKDLPYQKPYDMLIMASIIEKETGIDSERAKVASVFVNRLKAKMKLQTDPTIIYGLGDEYTGSLRRMHLTDENNPYNTYVIEGLPPTPIAMPSIASLEAAAHPAKTNYLFFVANGSGGHTFSTSYSNHQQAVNDYRKLLRNDN